MDKAARAALLTAKGMDKTSENIADYVADLLRQGRAKEVTDDLMKQADPQRLHHHYTSGNTGMNLPMDYASRMARANQMGMTHKGYHSTLKDQDRFDPTGKFMGYTGTSGISTTDNPAAATRYLDRYSEQDYKGVPFQKNIIPTLANIGRVDVRSEPYRSRIPMGYPLPEGYTPEHEVAGFDSAQFPDAISAKGQVKHSDAKNAIRSTETVMSDPTNIRSQFARFDPRLEHLAHLSASTGGAMDFARARTAVTRAGGQIAPSKYLPNVPRQVHAGGGKVAFMQGNHPDVPDVVYHGTNQDIQSFDPEARRSYDIDPRNPDSTNTGWFGKGHYFTPRPKIASHYADEAARRHSSNEGAQVYPVHLSMKNPFVVNMKDADSGATTLDKALNNAGVPMHPRGYRMPSEQTAALTAMGHDGVIAKREGKTEEIVAFHPHQIKSAIGNQGTFDPNDPDITKAGGGDVEGDNGHIYVVHGGSDFDQIDPSYSGRGEPGNIRPLGNGLYGYVLDHTDPENVKNAIGWSTRYSQKYGGGKKALHVFKVPKSSSTVFNGYRELNVEGYPKPIKGLGMEPTEELNAYEAHAATEPPYDPENSADYWAHERKGRALWDAVKNAADLRMQHLPIGLTEVAIQNPKVATRIGKFSLDTPTSDILDAVKDDVQSRAAGGRIHAEDGGKMELRSKAAEAIRNQPQLKGSVDQLLAVAAKGKGVKQAELANAGRPSGNIISKEKLAQHFEDAAPDVRVKRYQNIPAVGHTQDERREYNHLSYERVNNRLDEDQISRWHDLHNKTMPKGGTKYGKWTLDIGKNYREHLLHLPSAGGEVNHMVLGAYPRDFGTEAEAHEYIDRMNRAAEEPGMEPIRDSLRRYPLTYSPETPPSDKDFQSSHWEVPNVVAHVRMKDLFGGDGLFVQEVQSDWGQSGREQGFYDPQNPYEVVRKGTKEVVSRHPDYSSVTDAYRDHPDRNNLDYWDVSDEKVPQAPYVGNTQQWTDLALKHVLTEAAKNGKYKRVVFAPGEANADLYGQRRQIAQATLKPMPDEPEMLGELYGWDKDTGEQINHGPINDEKELASALGKKHAQALLAQPMVRNSHRSLVDPSMVLGGHGMVDYYNNIVHPSALKLLQQHDPSIQPEKPYEMPGQEGTDNYYKGLSLPMTETARQSILKNGFGTFKRGGTVDGEPDAKTENTPGSVGNGPQAGGFPIAGGIRGGESVLPAPLSPYGEVDLQGLPKDILIPKLGIKVTAGHNPEIRQVARDYTRQAGIDYSPPTLYKKVDPNLGKRISDAYADMAHFPQHPLVSAAYDAMKRETLDQYRMIQKAGVKMEFYPDVKKDPYHSQPRLMTEDVNNNKHMYVYPTVAGGFGTGKQPKGHENNPLLGDSGERWNGQPVVFNDLFRAVHDYFGHVKEGLGFRGDGEENAWRSHAAMYSPLARIALGAETRGQNSLLNYGPNGEHNRTASPEDTIYSPQKLGVMPVWALHEGAEFIKPEERAQMEAIYRHFGLGPEGFVEPKVQRAPSAFVGQQKMAPTAGMPPSGMFTSKPTLSKGGTVGKEEGGATGSLREKGLWPSAQAIKAGTGSREAHAEMVNKIKPVSPYSAPVPPASDEQVHDALTKDKQPKAFAPRGLEEGTPVAVRLDIPAYEKRNTWVVSVHHPKTDFTAGEVIGYDSVAHIDNPRFGVHPTGALNIASGKPKATIATVHGNWKKTTPEDAFKLSQTVHNDPQWRQVGMDPERHSYFYDRETQEPVMAADEALHIGPLVYAKNPVYGKKTDFAFSKGGDVSAAIALTRRFTKDGKAATVALKPKGK